MGLVGSPVEASTILYLLYDDEFARRAALPALGRLFAFPSVAEPGDVSAFAIETETPPIKWLRLKGTPRLPVVACPSKECVPDWRSTHMRLFAALIMKTGPPIPALLIGPR